MAADILTTVHGTVVLMCSPTGPPVDSSVALADLIGAALGQRAELVAVPLERLSPAFFDLESGVADTFSQRLSTYGLRAAVIGDLAGGEAFDDFATASTRGRELWFYPTFDAFTGRLDRRSR